MAFFEVIYLLATVLMSAYGFNSFLMAALYLCRRHEAVPRPPLRRTPTVTVQLPIFNEIHVVERLIEAATRLDYPRPKLQIQVLDDSTDETSAIAEEVVARFRNQGFDIESIHRDERTGFKAGALAKGLETAKGEFVAVFDADFVPQPDFLLKTIPYFLDRPRLGMVQTRWGHINADYSPLTRIQAIALDAHFIVEQTARNRSGLFMNFSGTAGVWRRSCVEEAGGWQGDTISEDLDLSYRAQLAGWEFLFLPDVVSPAEIPPQINALKRQQFRWAKGSIQCARKLWRPILTAPVPLFQRFQGMFHLTAYALHPMMILMLLCMLPLTIQRWQMDVSLSFLGLAAFGLPFVYAVSQSTLYRNWPQKFAYFPILIVMGTGISLSNTKAVIEGLIGRKNDFRRTPKFCLENREDQWMASRYVLPLGWDTIGEILLSAYALFTAWVACRQDSYYAVPFLLFYALSFGYMAALTVYHSWPTMGIFSRRRRPRRKETPRTSYSATHQSSS